MLKQGFIDTLISFLKEFLEWLTTPLDFKPMKWHPIGFFVVVMTIAGIASLNFDLLYGLKWLPLLIVTALISYIFTRYKEKNQPIGEKAELDEAQLEQTAKSLENINNPQIQSNKEPLLEQVDSQDSPTKNDQDQKKFQQGIPIKELDE